MNKYWRNPHGADHGNSGGASNAAKGKAIGGSGSDKTASWPGLPGKTQGKARNAGQPKTGHKGPFYVKAVGV